MARTSMDRDSKEYLHVPITTPAGVTLAADAVEVAVLVKGTRPIEADWQPAPFANGEATLLLGPALEPGQYRVWVRITDAPEAPLLQAGLLTIT